MLKLTQLLGRSRWFDVQISQSPSVTFILLTLKKDKGSLQRCPESECSVVLHVVVSTLQPCRKRPKPRHQQPTVSTRASPRTNYLKISFALLCKKEIGNLRLRSWKEVKSLVCLLSTFETEVSGHPARNRVIFSG